MGYPSPSIYFQSVSLFLECVSCRWCICCSCSVAQSCLTVTPWTAAHQASLSITSSQNLLKLMSIESVMPSNNFILAVPFSSCLQSLPVSGSFQMTLKSQLFTSGGQSIGVSASASVLPMNQSFSISPSTSGLISFGINWLDLVAVQGTLKSLLQHDSSKASILWHSTFFTV